MQADVATRSVQILPMPGRPPKILKTYPNRIREVREAKGLTQQQVSRAMGTSHQTIEKWELGKTDVGLQRLERVARALGVPTHTLVNGSNPANDSEERALIDLFRRLPANERRRALQLLTVLIPPEEPHERRRAS